MKKNLSIITILFTLFSYSQQEYKIGVNLFREEMGNLPTENITGKTLDSIVASISANDPNRTSGSGTTLKKVKLVIELEVPWDKTETSPGIYNFEWYKSFATLCEDKKIKWTPLLSPHYVPNFYINDTLSNYPLSYSKDKLKYLDGSNYPDFNFLRFSPNSSIWNDKVANWIKAFVHQMYTSNHFYSTSYQNRAIEELLVGNEMTYPFNKAISGDDATKTKWDQENPTVAYPSNSIQFLNFWNNTTLTPNLLKDFRNRHLAYCIAGMIYQAKTQLITDLGSANANNIGISSKLVSYLFPRADISISDEICGYDNNQLGYLINQSNKFLAIDSYTNPNGWDLIDDYNTTNIRTLPSGKSIYLSEFNRVNGSNPFVTTDFSSFLTSFPNIKYYVFFAWNPKGLDSHYKITEGQQLGLYNMLNSIVPKSNPIEATTTTATEVKFNNFASGAFTIPTPYNYTSPTIPTPLSISSNDVDWYKFIYGGNAYYLKVIQKTGDSSFKNYGLRLTINTSGTNKTVGAPSNMILNARTTTYLNTLVDTEMILYDANLFELASNDNISTTNKFSQIILDLNEFNQLNKSFSNLNNDYPIYQEGTEKIQNSNKETQPFEVTIFPNPAKKFIDIKINRLKEKYSLAIYDINNKSVYEESQISTELIKQVDITSFEKGMYFILISLNNNKSIIKMIKID